MKRSAHACQKFENLFDRQIEHLRKLGVSDLITKALIKKRSLVIKQASEMRFSKGSIYFIPVILHRYLKGIVGLVDLVRHEGKSGYCTYIEPRDVYNIVETPKDFYYMFGVDDGQTTLNMYTDDAIDFIEKRKRSCLTVDEIISLCVHCGVLSRHYVNAAGSRFKNDGQVPDLWLCNEDPELDSSPINSTHPKWGTPSCSFRE